MFQLERLRSTAVRARKRVTRMKTKRRKEKKVDGAERTEPKLSTGERSCP